jgi:hypothetical protein
MKFSFTFLNYADIHFSFLRNVGRTTGGHKDTFDSSGGYLFVIHPSCLNSGLASC